MPEAFLPFELLWILNVTMNTMIPPPLVVIILKDKRLSGAKFLDK